MANNSEQESQFKIMKMRPTSNTNSHGGGVIQQSVSGHGQVGPSTHHQMHFGHGNQYRSNNPNMNNFRSSVNSQGVSSIQSLQKNYSTSQNHHASQPTGYLHPNQQISQEQLQEQIQKLIKNNKKHFSKDQGAEDLHKYLKQVLHQYLDQNNPDGLQNDKQGFNDLINELIKLNQPLTAGPSAPGRMRSGKDRAHSEKTGNQAAGPSVSQGYHVQNPSQPHSGVHHQHHANSQNFHGHAHSAVHHTPKVGNLMSGTGQVSAHHGHAQNTNLKSPLVSTQKKMKAQKPTINLSINNNVQNVIVTGQYSGRQGAGHGGHNTAATTGPYSGNQGHIGGQNPSSGGGVIGSLNGGQVNPQAQPSNHLILGQAKQKRTSSEDNVNVQQQINANRQQHLQQQQYQQQQQQL